MCRQLNTLDVSEVDADSSEGVESNQTQSFAAQQKPGAFSDRCTSLGPTRKRSICWCGLPVTVTQKPVTSIKRVGLRSARLAAVFGLEHREMDLIRLVARCTTCSKSVSWTVVLRKPDALTQVEHRIMETNTLLGAEMLSGSELPVLRKARKIALCHQERGEGRSRVAALILRVGNSAGFAQIQVASNCFVTSPLLQLP